ncbi:MAG TPA: hypothetical protein VF904_17305 [Anaeromyxobacteraceae bacterium]
MPMMAMPMMCRMTCEMTKDGMVVKMMPMEGSGMGSGMGMMTERCNAMNAMMAMGMPCMMSCNGMPMMMGMRDEK